MKKVLRYRNFVIAPAATDNEEYICFIIIMW